MERFIKYRGLISEIERYKRENTLNRKVTITKDFIELFSGFLAEKIAYCESLYKEFKFDEHGRCVIGEQEAFIGDSLRDIESAINSVYKNSVYESIFEAMKSRSYREVKDMDGEYRIIDSAFNVEYFLRFYIDPVHVITKAHFKKEDGKLVNIKFTKILSDAFKIWSSNNETYKEIKSLLKEENEKEDKNMTRIFQLRDLKKQIEEQHPFTHVDRLLNNKALYGKEKVILSINPFDRLFMSKSSYCEDEMKEHITNFNSCVGSQYKIDENGDLIIAEKGHFCIDETLMFGMIPASCVVYRENGRSINVHGMPFYGMKERSVAWLEDSGVFLETLYPTRTRLAMSKVIDVFDKLGVDASSYGEDDETLDISYNAFTNKILNNITPDGLFLDRLYISQSQLYKLENLRVDYSYSTGTEPVRRGDICPCCEDEFDEEYSTWVVDENGEEIRVCDDCIGNHYYWCNGCDQYHHNENGSVRSFTNGDEEFICDDCFEDGNYIVCYSCDCVVSKHHDWTEIDNDYYCEDCAQAEFARCEECLDYHSGDKETLEGDSICDYCYNNDSRFEECEECHRIGTTADIDDFNGKRICYECLEKEQKEAM